MSVRKARIVTRLVSGRNAADAVNVLRFTSKDAAPLVAKLIDSAIANARREDESVDLDQLVVTYAYADKASTRFLRRWRPRAQGRATRVEKGASHITIVIGDVEGAEES
ncbi:MAG: 50S ribosomal protein L22 [Proteobacteria bacterium]|nr:50S ribosomal protein L22 [Pseudomonadota bacterium]